MIAMHGEIEPHAPSILPYPQIPDFHSVEYTFSNRTHASASRGRHFVRLQHIVPGHICSRPDQIGEIAREGHPGIGVLVVDVVLYESCELLLVSDRRSPIVGLRHVGDIYAVVSVIVLSRLEGVIFYVVFIGFLVYLIISAKNGNSESDSIELTEKDKTPRLILFIIIGLALVVVGSNFTVNAASYIAGKLGMTERLIGLTIVAFGTSLPELVTSCTAAKKGQTDIAIGNIVGSNIFNILFVAGTTMLITPVQFEQNFLLDGIMAIVAAVLLWVCSVRKKKLTRPGGIVMLAVYAVYFAYIMYKNYM